MGGEGGSRSRANAFCWDTVDLFDIIYVCSDFCRYLKLCFEQHFIFIAYSAVIRPDTSHTVDLAFRSEGMTDVSDKPSYLTVPCVCVLSLIHI